MNDLTNVILTHAESVLMPLAQDSEIVGDELVGRNPQRNGDTGRVLRSSEYDPDATAMFTPNSVQETFQVIADPRLDADDAAAWYMAADPAQHDTIELAFLDGNEVPYLETKDGWSTDGVEYKVRHDFVATAIDFRGLYMNDGN